MAVVLHSVVREGGEPVNAGIPRYSVEVYANKGFDPDYPVSEFPFVVFIRDIVNPLASAWSYKRNRAEAEAMRAEVRVSITARV